MKFQGFMGMPMDDKMFYDMQKENPWFQAGGFFDMPSTLNISKLKQGEMLSQTEQLQVLLGLIFGSFGLKRNLDEAITGCNFYLNELEKLKPTKDRDRDNELWMTWQHQYGEMQIIVLKKGSKYLYDLNPYYWQKKG